MLYPYEILRLLTGDTNGSFAVRNGAPLPARGRFEEWDLESAPEEARARAERARRVAETWSIAATAQAWSAVYERLVR